MVLVRKISQKSNEPTRFQNPFAQNTSELARSPNGIFSDLFSILPHFFRILANHSPPLLRFCGTLLHSNSILLNNFPIVRQKFRVLPKFCELARETNYDRKQTNHSPR